MRQRGIERFRKQQAEAAAGGRMDESSAGSTLLRQFVLAVAEHITEYMQSKRRNPNAKMLEFIEVDTLAFLTLKTMFGSVFSHGSKEYPLISVADEVGRRIEDEYRMRIYEAHNEAFYNSIMTKLNKRKDAGETYKRASVSGQFRKVQDFNPTWWTPKQREDVGLIPVALVLEATDLFNKRTSRSKKHGGTFISPTAETIEWITSHDEAMELLMPERMPMLVPPEPWTEANAGGYLTAEMREMTPFVIVSRYNPSAAIKKYIGKIDPLVFEAANILQETPWQVNKQVLEVMRVVWEKNLQVGMPATQPVQIPPSPVERTKKVTDFTEDEKQAFLAWKAEARELHNEEAERVAHNLMVSRTLRMAKEMEEHEAFYYVWRADSRGRHYTAATGLSPQAGDHGKGLLRSAVGYPIKHADGARWFRIHGANKFGFDKASYQDRVAFIDARREDWLAVARDPIGRRDVWAEADKPYQFLAWCFEYAGFIENGYEHVSYLAIAQDGSCNGLQHFSAMLRDPVGGKAVNLLPGQKPEDIYSDVGARLPERLSKAAWLTDEDGKAAQNWLMLFRTEFENKVPRKLPKPPVMTLPYGSTQRTCTSTSYKWYRSTGSSFFGKHAFQQCIRLTPHLWASIGDVVISARECMAFVRKVAGIMAKDGKGLHWHTPDGFPVFQACYATDSVQIHSRLAGGLKITSRRAGNKLDASKQRSSGPPNFVHSMDATHMRAVIRAARAELGITFFAMIHDDFGVPACFAQRFNEIIREQFVWLYHEHDPLENFRAEQQSNTDVELPDLPEKGRLDIQQVLESEYFFG